MLRGLLAILVLASATAARAADGIFLVASDELQDPNFEHAVVLITHNTNFVGPFGVIINRPIPITLAEATRSGDLARILEVRPSRCPLDLRGPIASPLAGAEPPRVDDDGAPGRRDGGNNGRQATMAMKVTKSEVWMTTLDDRAGGAAA